MHRLQFGGPVLLVVICIRRRLNRLSTPRAWRSADRQFASNHGVIGLALRRTCTTEQCWSKRSVIVTRYCWIRLSTSMSPRAEKSEHNGYVARSAVKASNDKRRHARLLTVCVLTLYFLTHSVKKIKE